MSIRGLSKVPKKELAAIKREIEQIGALIQDRRKELGWTQEELADELDVNYNTIKYIEQGRRIPSLPMLLRVSRVLNLKIALEEP